MSLYEEWKEVSDIDPTEDEKGYKEHHFFIAFYLFGF